MKYGLIVHFKTQNIGDDIQSYAMEKFLPHVDYLIDREHLDSFYTETGEKVAALLGGWYLHKPLNWPPSPFLKLLPVSFHVTQRAGKGMLALTDYGARWLKKFDSIGCRDMGTVKMLKRSKVKGYLSGCFTLTIKPFEDVTPHGKIILTDLPDDIVNFIQSKTNKDTVIVSHKYTQPLIPQEVADFAKEHAREDVIPLSHYPACFDKPYLGEKGNYYPGNWNYRRAFIEGLLRFYQGASLVVTTRLHATLPCLALGTPVLFLNTKENLSYYRFSSFVPYVNHATFEDILEQRYFFDFNSPPPSNPGGHEKFVQTIQAKCADFINSCETDTDETLLDVENFLDNQKRSLRLKRIVKMLAPGAAPLNPKLENDRLYNF